MSAKLVFLAGVGVGYVLGSRAGRARYEQLTATVRRVTDSPTVQEAAGLVQAQAGRLAHAGRGAVSDRISDSRLGHSRVAERLFHSAPYPADSTGDDDGGRRHSRHNGVGHG